MTTPRRFIAEIGEVSAADLYLVGGKGANLGELVQAGLPVPRAFCVTTTAYKAFVESNALQGMIADALVGADYTDVVDLTARADWIRARFVAAPTPPDIESEIRRAYQQLGAVDAADFPVSVRSSATAEDLPGTSFAGQQDTYLYISGADRVIEHVKRCWASLWTDRAISYRNRQGFRHEDVLLAVVVQEMFPSEIAGVMFTANPVTSNPHEVFINTSWGLGEAIVSGRVNPDQYIVNRDSLAFVEKKIHDKVVMTVRRDDGLGSEERHVPDDKRRAETLTDAQVLELVGIGLRIEAYYGFPQDIEWGYAHGRFAILQSREVTAADLDFSEGLEAYKTPQALAEMKDEGWLWSRGWSDEVQTGPSTPWWYSYFNHNMTLFRTEMFELMGTEELFGCKKGEFENIPVFRWYGARAYINLAVERERIRRFTPPFARSDAALWIFPKNQRDSVGNSSFNWPQFLSTLWNLHLTKPHVSLLGNHKHGLDNMPAWKQHEADVWSKIDMETASARLMTDLQFNLRIDTGFATNVCLPFSIYLFFLPAAFKFICRDWFNDQDEKIYGALISGLASKTSDENIAIWNLSRAVRKSPALMDILRADAPLDMVLGNLKASPEAGEFNQLFDAFIAAYGHRGGKERDAFHPRYRHQPHNVLVHVRSMVNLDEESSPAVKEYQNAKSMRETRENCLKTLREGEISFLRVPFFAWLVDFVQQWMYYRDFERFYNDMTMCRPRDWLTVLAHRFIRQGLLTDVEDIFFLGKEEVVMVDEGKLDAKQIALRVRSRRRVYERYAHREPPKYIQGWRFFNDEQLEDDGLGLRGIAASGGQATGRARVCRNLEDIGKIEKGDILVTVATDPGWTTAFSFIGGVVVETGGVISHAVMISREYGLPCVANLSNACDRIPDGATITLDGTNGRVVIHDQA